MSRCHHSPIAFHDSNATALSFRPTRHPRPPARPGRRRCHLPSPTTSRSIPVPCQQQVAVLPMLLARNFAVERVAKNRHVRVALQPAHRAVPLVLVVLAQPLPPALPKRQSLNHYLNRHLSRLPNPSQNQSQNSPLSQSPNQSPNQRQALRLQPLLRAESCRRSSISRVTGATRFFPRSLNALALDSQVGIGSMLSMVSPCLDCPMNRMQFAAKNVVPRLKLH